MRTIAQHCVPEIAGKWLSRRLRVDSGPLGAGRGPNGSLMLLGTCSRPMCPRTGSRALAHSLGWGAFISVVVAGVLATGCDGVTPEGRDKPIYGYSAAPDPAESADAVAPGDAAVADAAGGGDGGVADGGATDGGAGVDGVSPGDGAGGGGDGAVPSDGSAGADGGGPDAASAGDGSVGSPCKLEADCKDPGAVCLDWPGGYCTILDCLPGGTDCPGESECHIIDDGITACLDPCSKQADCRSAYDCKRLIRQDGTFAQACFSTAPGAGGPASLCKHAKDCAGQATCLTFMPSGYCAVVGCGAGIPCPVKTSCVSLGEINACLSDCDGAHPCPGSAAKIQSCTEDADIQGEPVNVCLTGDSGKEIGDFCTQDLDCKSKHCTIHATGRCAPGEQLCDDDADCGATGGTCDIKAEYLVGSCGQACDLDTLCPEASVCVRTAPTTGECSLACKSLSDVFTCDEALAQSCLVGDPYGGDGTTDTYACFSQPVGQVGAHCDTAPEGPGCASGLTCFQGSGSTGYCTTSCGSKDFCPWTTVCGSTGAFEQCLRRCKAKTDCPDGFECISKPVVTGVSQKVCFPL